MFVGTLSLSHAYFNKALANLIVRLVLPICLQDKICISETIESCSFFFGHDITFRLGLNMLEQSSLSLTSKEPFGSGLNQKEQAGSHKYFDI